MPKTAAAPFLQNGRSQYTIKVANKQTNKCKLSLSQNDEVESSSVKLLGYCPQSAIHENFLKDKSSKIIVSRKFLAIKFEGKSKENHVFTLTMKIDSTKFTY